MEIKSADKWALVTTKNGGAPLPVRGIEGCFSPNGFQLLQDMREEGEIDEAEEVEEDGSEVEEEEVNLEESVESAVGEDQVAGTQEAHNKVKMLADSIEDDERNAGAMATKKQSSSLWGRGRGSKRGSCSGPATEGAELNQKGFLSEALMSSIFAWNMRGFNQPRKQKVVRYWVKAAKLSIGCLLETKVKEENFTKVFDAIFPRWSCVHNYSSHRLGRIWVCWSDDVEVCPVSTSMQMITVWVRYKASEDTFLCSFVYASNYANERKELWREMEEIGRSVASNPWIIQGDLTWLSRHKSTLDTLILEWT